MFDDFSFEEIMKIPALRVTGRLESGRRRFAWRQIARWILR